LLKLSKNRLFHYGTLLFKSSLEKLSLALKANPIKFEDKAAKSLRNRVTNICDYLSAPLEIEVFKKMILDKIRKENKYCSIYDFTDSDNYAVKILEVLF